MHEILNAIDKIECTKEDALLIVNILKHELPVVKAFKQCTCVDGGKEIRIPIQETGGEGTNDA